MKKSKIVLIVIGGLLVASILACVVALSILQIKTNSIMDDYSSVFSSDKYKTPVYIDGVEVITQDVSCGYAVIEMFSSWNGGDITEEKLYSEYGKVVTSTGDSFEKEMNKQFSEYETTIHKWLKNTELIDMVYENLSRGIPVPFEWAAKFEGQWTLHYSLIIGMDIPKDKITVANPYGYYEELTVSEFLDRTSFASYENMSLFLRLGFAFGIFEKNTVFTVH